MKPYLERLLQHADWANVRLLNALQAMAPPEPHAVHLFAHLLTTERLYLERLRGLDPWPQDFWPELSLDACATLVAANRTAYREFLNARSEADLGTAVKYRNSKGQEFHTPIQDMLLHVALHSSYHRGQIAAAIRQAGGEPVNTDFIIFVREGH